MGEMLAGIPRDARLAVRSLLRTPGFTVVCVLTLALGIGPSTALFTVLRGLVLAPLPYPDADRLVAIRRDLVVRGIPNYPAAPADLVDYRARSDAFQAIAGYFGAAPVLTDGDRTERLTGLWATPELFEVLGVVPALGRGFTPEEGIAVAQPEGEAPWFPIVLSHAFWVRRFASDPDIVGRTLSFGPASAEVVGVLPEGFRLTLSPDDGVPLEPDVMLPYAIDPTDPFRGSFFMRTIGRLAPGVSLGMAAARMEAVSAWQRTQYPSAQAAGTTTRLVPLQDDVGAGVRPLLLRLGGALAFVLLIACANVANLLLVRSAGRGRELSIRRALGGGRARVVRQLLTESAILALAGGALGVALAWVALPVLGRALPPELPRLEALTLNVPALAFSLATAMAAALLFGILPALRGSRADVMDALRGRSGVSGSSARVRSGLVVVEVALSFVLVVGAGLMVRSFMALQRVDPGFDAHGVLAFDATLPPGAYPSPGAETAVREQLRAQLLALPGAQAVGVGSSVPLGGGGGAAPYGGEAELADGDESDLRQANVRFVGGGYFETLGTPLLAGRELVAADVDDEVVKVLVDEVLAERTWPGESAVGKRVYVKVAMPGIWFEVAGVVGHQRQDGLTGPSRETIYFPAGYRGVQPSRWTVRTSGEPTAMAPGVRAAVARVDERILVENLEALTARVDRASAPTRLVSRFVGAFGLLALALALVGLYGVVTYMVRERSGEFGLRMALGAGRSGILRLVLTKGLLLSGLGIAVGLAGTFGLTRTVAGFVVGVAPTDPLTLGVAAALFVAMAVAASLVPALRAVGVDPAVTLREE
jgi:predicted permease